MHGTAILAFVGLLVLQVPKALASDPDPANSTIRLSGAAYFGCQWVFGASCSIDTLFIHVEVRDAANNPVPSALVWVNTQARPGTIMHCNCLQTVTTGPMGRATLPACKLAGRGSTVNVCVLARAPGGPPVILGCPQMPVPRDFTSSDLDASCDASPASSTTIVDLGIWASALPPGPYHMWADYNCDGLVGVADLGIWATGLGFGC